MDIMRVNRHIKIKRVLLIVFKRISTNQSSLFKKTAVCFTLLGAVDSVELLCHVILLVLGREYVFDHEQVVDVFDVVSDFVERVP